MSNLNIEAKARGKFRVQKINIETGDIYFDSGEFENALLDNYFSSGSVNIGWCFVGSDSQVNFNDTSMSSIGSPTGNRQKSTSVSVDSNGLVTWNYINKYTFNSGAIIGNMSSIGLSTSNNFSANNLKIKSLIKDTNGNPTAITATASDQIIVTHTLSITFNQLQNLGSISIDGNNHSVEFYTTYIAAGEFVGNDIVGSAPLHFFNGGVPPIFFKIGQSFTPPQIPNSGFSTHPISVGASIGYKTGSALFDSVNKKLIAEWTMQIPANINLPGDAGIKFLGAANDNNDPNQSFFTYVFTPPLPKNSSIAYSIGVQLSISRA